MKIPGRQLRSEKLRSRVERFAVFDAALDPDLVEPLFLPVRKKADAVSARLDLLEVVFHLLQWEIFVNVLAHRESRLQIERNFCDRPQRAQSNHRSTEMFRHPSGGTA